MREAGKGRKTDSPLDSLELNATHQHLILILKTHFGLWTYKIIRWHINGVLSWQFVMSIIENWRTWFMHSYVVFIFYSQMYSISNNIHTEWFQQSKMRIKESRLLALRRFLKLPRLCIELAKKLIWAFPYHLTENLNKLFGQPSTVFPQLTHTSPLSNLSKIFSILPASNISSP